MIAVSLPPELENRLEALAKSTGRSTNSYVEEAIVEYIDDLENLYLAERRLEDVRAGRDTTVSLADLMGKHGLAD